MEGVLQYKLEVYCGVSLSPMLSASEAQHYKRGGVLRYKLEVYRQYFSDTLYALGVPEHCPSMVPEIALRLLMALCLTLSFLLESLGICLHQHTKLLDPPGH